MHSFLMVSLLLIAAGNALAQPTLDFRPEIEVQGRVDEIEADPQGRLWVSTALGHIYRSDDLGRSWGEVSISGRKLDPSEQRDLGMLKRVTFFDRERALISGYLGSHKDEVFVSSDSGHSWKAVRLPVSLWVYDAFVDEEGHAWLVGSSGDILFSGDYGATWDVLPRPFKKKGRRTHHIYMEPEGLGVVSRLGDGLRLTRDGGLSWEQVPTPKKQLSLPSCDEAHGERATRPGFLGGDLLVAQCGQAYRRGHDGKWTDLVPGRIVVAYELAGAYAILVTEDLRVHRLREDRSVEDLGFQLERTPIDIAVHGNVISFLDGTRKVTVFDQKQWFSSRLLGAGRAESWPIRHFDIDAEGIFWGVSSYFLYRSRDHGQTWERVTELPEAVRGLAVDGQGDVVLWDGHGWNARWSAATGSFSEVPGLTGLDVVGSFRRPDVWLLFGGLQHETRARIEVARSYFAGQFAGSSDFGWVAASLDAGRTWKEIDRWSDGGPQKIFLGDDNRLTLISWLGAIRQGSLSLEPLGLSMETLLPATDETLQKVPYVERVLLLDFLSAKNAWVMGWTHHQGESLFHSSNNGRSWSWVAKEKNPARGLWRLFDGSWVKVDSDGQVKIRAAQKFRTLGQLPKPFRKAFLSSNGHLVIELEDGALWMVPSREEGLRPLSGGRELSRDEQKPVEEPS